MSEEVGAAAPRPKRPEKLSPGQVWFDCDAAVETTFEAHGSKALYPGAPDILWKFPSVRLRRDIGRIASRKDIQHRPGLRMGLSLVRQMSSIGELATDDFKGDADAVGVLAKQGDTDISTADFMYLLMWRAWERFGDAWQYPHPFSCSGCDTLITGAEIDLSQITVFTPTRADGTVTYRLRHPWKRIGTEIVVEVTLGRPKFSYALVNCSKNEWDEDDDWAIRVREVASAIQGMVIKDGDGEQTRPAPGLIAHQSLDVMHELDLEALSKFVSDLRLAGGTGRIMKYTHETCGAVSNLQLNWKTDFLESSGA